MAGRKEEETLTREEAEQMAVKAVARIGSIIARMCGYSLEMEVYPDSYPAYYVTGRVPIDPSRSPSTFVKVSVEKLPDSSGLEEKSPPNLSHIEPF